MLCLGWSQNTFIWTCPSVYLFSFMMFTLLKSTGQLCGLSLTVEFDCCFSSMRPMFTYFCRLLGVSAVAVWPWIVPVFMITLATLLRCCHVCQDFYYKVTIFRLIIPTYVLGRYLETHVTLFLSLFLHVHCNVHQWFLGLPWWLW